MDRYGARAATFCEHCGIHREQLGDETIMPFRECPTCGQAVCPNCWNIVGNACLRCVPFMLPNVATAADPRVAAAPPDADDESLVAAAISRTAAGPTAALALPQAVLGGSPIPPQGSAPASKATPATTDSTPSTKARKSRSIKPTVVLGTVAAKGAAAAAAGVAAAEAARAKAKAELDTTVTTTVTAHPLGEVPVPEPTAGAAAPAAVTPEPASPESIVPAQIPTAPEATAPAATAEVPAALPAAAVVAMTAAAVDADPPRSTPNGPAAKSSKTAAPKRSGMPKLPTATKAAVAAPVVREVQWPDRSQEWQARPGQPEPSWSVVERQRPPDRPGATPPPVAAAAAASARPASGRRERRLAGLIGFVVLAVALFGVAGITLAALGGLPMGQAAVATVGPETAAPTAAPTDIVTPAPAATPKPTKTTKPRATDRGTTGTTAGGGGNAAPTKQPDETVSTGGAGFQPTPKPTPKPTPTLAPTPDPTPVPTPTPTPDPTPVPTP